MSTVAPCPSREVLQRLIAGQLAPFESEPLAQHLEHCSACADTVRMIEQEDTLVDSIQESHRVAATEDELVDQVIARVLRRGSGERSETSLGDSPAEAIDAAELSAILLPPEAPDEIGRLGGYRVIEVLGAGGMGIVFRAEDRHLRRSVALKVMKRTIAKHESARQRFLREAQAAAAIEHDHIVTIYQVGEDNHVPFLAMQWLHGETLEERLKRDAWMPFHEVVRVGSEIAEGLAAAHRRSLIHRDIKPANVWLEAESGRVKILDFGLARAAHDPVHLTQQGAIAGTPAYMAPEQAAGDPVDARADLFSLGVVLYRISTGDLPFKGSSTLAVLSALAQHQPKPPHELNPALPPAFSHLVGTLLAKSPTDRPDSAQAVAEQLKQLASGAGTPQRRASRRRPTLLAVVVTLAAACGLIAFDQYRRATLLNRRGAIVQSQPVSNTPAAHHAEPQVESHPAAEASTGEPVEPSEPSATVALHPMLESLKLEIDAGVVANPADPRVAKLRQRLVEHRGQWRSGPDTAAAAALMSRLPWPIDALRKEEIPEYEGRVAGDGQPTRAPRALAAVLGDSRLKHWAAINSAAFSPDAKLLASASNDQTVRLWDSQTGEQHAVLLGHSGPVIAVAFSPNGAQVVSAGADRMVKIWDTASAELLGTLTERGSGFATVAYSPDGRFLASACADRHVHLWNPATRQHIETIHGCPDVVTAVEFHPDKKTLAIGCRDGNVLTCQPGSRTRVQTVHKEAKSISDLAFSHDGRLLAVASLDKTFQVLDMSQQSEPIRITDTEPVRSIVFLGDTRRLATINRDRQAVSIKTWDLDDPGEPRAVGKHGDEVYGIASSPDGSMLATAGADYSIRLWNTEDATERTPTPPHHAFVRAVAISRDGATLASVSHDATLIAWDVLRGKRRFPPVRPQPVRLRDVAISPDGRMIASACQNDAAAVKFIDANNGIERRHPVQGIWPYAMAFSPDGTKLATGNTGAVWDKKTAPMSIWSVASGGDPLHIEGHEGGVNAIKFSDDGRKLATGGSDKTIKLWDPSTGNEIRTLTGHEQTVQSIAFSPDGSKLVSGSMDHTVRIWDVESTEQKTLTGHAAGVMSVLFSPDGQTIASCAADGTLRIWDTASGRLIENIPLGPPGGFIYDLAFSPDGRHIITANGNGTLYVLRLHEFGG